LSHLFAEVRTVAMIFRLGLAFVLAVVGLATSSPSTISTAHNSGPVPSVVASLTGTPAPAATGSNGAGSVTERDVVVPPVAPGGDVVQTPVERAAQAAEGAIVTDRMVATGRVASQVVETGKFQTVGLTWPSDTGVASLGAEVRTRAEGQWSDWVPLDTSDAAPDAGSADARRAVRDGTDSVWVGDSDAVQLSFTATKEGGPAGLSLALIGSPDLPALPTGGVAGPAMGSSPVRLAPQASAPLSGSSVLVPHVITRAEWGASAPVCTPDVATTLVGAVLHHTAGPNTYSTVAEAEQQIRNDQRYHIQSRGWCDLGYNFVVDKWGNIYEGRANSMTEPVIGVHAGGFNTGTVGIAMLGTYSDVNPSAATREAVAEVIGWRLGAYGVNPQGMMTYTTGVGENSRFLNQTVALPRVFGHRDVAYTACPGNAGYAALGWIRARATTLAFSESLVRALYHDMLQRGVDPTGMATWSGQLLAGTPASVLADTLAHSDEYVARRVVEAYQEILGRGPDPTGFATWTQAITSGRLRAEDLRGQLIQSDEYYSRAGGTDASYIARLYQDILHRGAGADEIASWSAAIQTSGRGAAPYGVWRSLESAQLRVHEIYNIYLDRMADGNGLATWGPYWQIHGEDLLRGQITGSDEYLARSARLFS
jgi:hypothetical protein